MNYFVFRFCVFENCFVLWFCLVDFSHKTFGNCSIIRYICGRYVFFAKNV